MKSKCEELSGLHEQLKESRTENSKLTERLQSMEALLEAGRAQDTPDAQVSRPLLPRVDESEGGCHRVLTPLCRRMRTNGLPP